MSLIKIYRTPTTTNERLPAEQQNGYHGFANEQFTEGEVAPIRVLLNHKLGAEKNHLGFFIERCGIHEGFFEERHGIHITTVLLTLRVI